MSENDFGTVLPAVKDLLVPYDRPVRIELASWADDLCKRIEGDDPRQLSAALNNAALIYAYLGEFDLARWACLSHLTWLARVSLQDRATLALAFQPWINIGRIEALAKDPITARNYFELLPALRRQAALRLADCRIDPADWPIMLSYDPKLPTVLSNVLVIDGVKSWFLRGDYGGALQFLDDVREYELYTPPVTLHEAEVICHVGLGAHASALEAAAHWQHTDDYLPAVIRLRLLPSLVTLGSVDTALRYADVLVEAAASGRWPWLPPTTMLRFLERTALTLRWLGVRDQALGIARMLLVAADGIGDQVSVHGAVQILAALESDPAEARRCAQLQRELEVTSDYSIVRKASHEGPRLGRSRKARYADLAIRIKNRLDVASPPV